MDSYRLSFRLLKIDLQWNIMFFNGLTGFDNVLFKNSETQHWVVTSVQNALEFANFLLGLFSHFDNHGSHWS